MNESFAIQLFEGKKVRIVYSSLRARKFASYGMQNRRSTISL